MLRNRWCLDRGAAARAAAVLVTLALTACSSGGSRPAQQPPNDLGLAQCELVDGTVLGEPMAPIMIDGDEVQACRIDDEQIRGGAGTAGRGLTLKATHQYKPLAWVIAGTLTIGDNRTYASLQEFTSGSFATLTIQDGAIVRAAEGARIVIHRNGFLSGDLTSLDDNLDGSGEWGGIVVNGIGSHIDCPADTSKEKFCNIEGEHGYYGGLSAADARTEDVSTTILLHQQLGYQVILGFAGSVSEAGGAVAGQPMSAAVVFNAPQTDTHGRALRVGAFDVAGTAIEINGGYVGSSNAGPVMELVTRNTGAHAVYWHSGFAGSFTGVFHHGQADHAALYGVGGDVDLNGITLVDRDFSAGTAIRVDGGKVHLSNLLVQNFAGCLQLDATASATFAGTAFGCLQPTIAAADGIDHAAAATTAALADPDAVYFELDPALNQDLSVGNPQLTEAYAAFGSADAGGRAALGGNNIAAYASHDLRLIYPECFGVGTLLPEDQILTVRNREYRICELSGAITANVRLSSRFNEGDFAWVLNGAVSLGKDFAGLDEAAQLAALQTPSYVFLPAGAKVYGRAGASLTVHPGVRWLVEGTLDDPVEIAALPAQENAAIAHWGGVTVHGVDHATCEANPNAGVCAHANNNRLRIEYLRLLQAGAGQPALTLHDVGPGETIDYLDISASASHGLVLDGGRANIDRLLLVDSVGDQLSWQHGYRGTVQYSVIRSGTPSRGHVLHGRNDENNPDASPRSRPVLANLTMVNGGGMLEGAAIRLAQGSGLLLYNSVASGFVYCLDIDDAATAALQASAPRQIAMSNVILGCEATLALDEEDGGQDYANLVAQSGTVHALDPQLDSAFLPMNPALPAAGNLDLSLAGAAAGHLDSDAGYWGAIAGANDGWYLGWSDLGVLLSADCDGKGALVTDDYPYPFYVGTPLAAYNDYTVVAINYKICQLQNVLSQDLELTRYTGEDATAMDGDGNVTVAEPGSKYGLPGEVTWKRPAVPTIWLLDGMVTVGDGARELADPAEAQLLKAEPVELTMRPGTWIMATETGGLHVTRGARLRILGEPMTMDDFCPYYGRTDGWCSEFAKTGPVSMFGLPLIPGSGMWPTAEVQGMAVDYAPYAPLGNSTWNSGFYWVDYTVDNTSAWQGIVVDGFARNNQCDAAATAEPGSQICNIAATLGYHGGYDDAHENLEIHNLYMAGGLLQLNSVAGEIDGLRYQPPNHFSSEQTGEASVVAIDGGRVNIRELLIELVNGVDSEYYNNAKPGSLIRWNHGYQGSLQHIYGFTHSLADGQETRIQANGRDYFVPLIRGANGDPGHEDDLPRSMPTIANLSLVGTESPASPIDSSAIELVRGSGLYLYNAAMGLDEEASFQGGVASDYCFKLDSSVAQRVAAGEFVVSQLAATCLSLSDNASVPAGTMTGVSNSYSNSGAVFFGRYSPAGFEQYFVDQWGGLDRLPIRVDHNRRYPLQQVVDDYGHVTIDFSSSPTADTEFLEATDYLGTLNYWMKP